VASTSSRNRLSTPAREADTSADVEVVSAYKSYGDVVAVNGVDLLVRAGDPGYLATRLSREAAVAPGGRR
jgi:hypothetical protein